MLQFVQNMIYYFQNWNRFRRIVDLLPEGRVTMGEALNIYDIARLANVSVSTVSRVLNNHPDVSEKTRNRIRAIIRQYGFVPNNNARSLSRERFHAVGVIIRDINNPFFTRMLSIIQEALAKEDFPMIVQSVDPLHGENEISAALTMEKERRPSGFLFLGGNFQAGQDKLLAIAAPIVMLTTMLQTEEQAFSTVSIDDRTEAYRLGHRVCASGHRHIALIGYSEDTYSVSGLRSAGFLKALAEQGVECTRVAVPQDGNFSASIGYEAARRLLAMGQYTCCFCFSDILAMGAMRAFHEAGLRMPADISILGFDGIEGGRYTIPSLASVRQPAEAMTRRSVDILLHSILYDTPRERVIFPAEFVPGESFRPLV